MHRLFVALRPPPAIRAALLAATGGVEGARWQDDAQLHLTLRFVGEVETPQAEDVATALAGVAHPAVEARIDGVGTFDRKGRVDTLWARVAGGGLATLHRKVDGALARAGVARDERRFLPHLTLARFGRRAGDPAGIARWLAAQAGLASEPFAFEHLYLFESRLGHDGAAYEAVSRWPLV